MDALPATEAADYVIAAYGRTTQTDQLADASAARVTGISVTVAAVIFDDATASGDESLVSSLFARRVTHRQTWNTLHAILSDARARSSDPSEVLEKINADIEALIQKPGLRDSGDYGIIRRRALAGLQGTRSPQDVLRSLTSVITIHRDMFETQAARRPGPQ